MANPQQDVDRGRRAKELLENELFNEAWINIRTGLVAVWEATNTLDAETRERCFLSVKLLDRLKAEFVRVLQGGKLAALEIVELERERARKAG